MTSLQEKLMDDSPASSRPGDIAMLRMLVSRDLEHLLNTRSEGARLIPNAFEACRQSLLTYGIPDFSSYNLLNPHDRERIRRTLEQAISQHEHRLTRIRIKLDPPQQYERVLRFKVEAVLNLGAEREKVQFDAVLQLLTQCYAVS